MIRSMWLLVAWLVSCGVVVAQDGKALPPVRVSSGVMMGLLITPHSDCMMTHEELLTMYRAKGSGTVMAEMTVSETGHVEEVTLLRGSPGLADACLRSYRSRVFKPYLVDGKAVRVSTTFIVNYNFGGPDPELQRELTRTAAVPAEPFCGDERKRVSSGTMAGQLVSRPDPVLLEPLPTGAHVSGAVVMKVCISKEGLVEKVQVISGPEVLRKKTVETISRWKYHPYLADGVAVPVETTVVVYMEFGGG